MVEYDMDEEDVAWLSTWSSHVFTNPEFSICNVFFVKNIVNLKKKNKLSLHFAIYFDQGFLN